MKTIKKVKRGDTKSYTKSMLLFSGLIIGFIILFYIYDPFFIIIWGKRSGWYLDKYRTLGAKIWRMFYRTTSHWQLAIWLPILWGFAVYCFQRGLKKEKAMIFNETHSIVIFILAGFSFFSFFGLMSGPLI